MISGCAQYPHGEEAIKLLQNHEITFSCILKVSARLQDLDLGRCLHAGASMSIYLIHSWVLHWLICI